MRRVLLIFLAFGLLYAGGGLLPGRTLLPLDLVDDLGAWKPDPATRVRVSNSLLSDPIVSFLPWDAEILRLLAAGQFPWVHVSAGEGAPLFANPQTAMFSPFTWPRFAFGLHGWALMALLKLLAAGLGLFWLASELGVPRRAALVSGLIYAGSGFLIVWLLFPHTQVAAILPALAAAGLRLMSRPSRGHALAVLLLAAWATAGGHPETLFIGVSGIALFLLVEARARPELGLFSLGRPALWAGLGFLLLAVQTLPFLLLLADSVSAAERPSQPHSFRSFGLLAEVWPGALGSPLAGELDLSAAFAPAENFNNRTAGYVGALALLAIFTGWRQLPPSLRRGLAIGAAAFFLSLYPPLFTPLLKKVPILGLAAFEYLVVLFVLFASLAAGPALALLAASPRRRLGIALLVVGLCAGIAGFLPVLPAARPVLAELAGEGIDRLRESGHLRQKPEIYQQRLAFYLEAAGATAWRRLALPGGCLLLAGLALCSRRLSSDRRELLLAAAAIGELVVFGWGYNPAVARSTLPPEPDFVATVRALDPEGRYLIGSHLTVFPPNLATLYQLRDVVSYDVLTGKKRSAELERGGYDPLQHSLRSGLAPAEVEQLGRLGVRFVISRDEVPGASRLPGPPPPAAGLYEIPNAVPSPPPVNAPPPGFGAGLAISLLAALGAVFGLRRA